MLRALLFDFDGLILDTETPCYEAWNEIFKEHGTALPQELWIDIIGRPPGDHDPLALLESRIGRSLEREPLRQRHREREHRRILEQPVLPGVRQLIAAASAASMRLAVASSSERSWVEEHLERIGLLNAFETLACASETVPGKPSPDVYLAAMRALDVRPEECVALEDSLNGVDAAVAAGILCVAVPGPLLTSRPFPAAALRVDTVAELSISRLTSLLGSETL